MPTRSKIIFLVTDPKFFLSHRLPMAQAALNVGMEVVVATNLLGGAPPSPLPGLHFVHIPFKRQSFSPFAAIGSMLAIARLYRRERPAIVHHIALRPILCGSLAAFMSGVPATINAFTGLGYVFSANTTLAKILRVLLSPVLGLLLNGSDRRALFQNDDDRDELIRRGIVTPESCAVILGSGVDMKTFKPLPFPSPDPYFICAFPARMIGIKGLTTLKAAAALLEKEAPQVRLWLCGASDPGNPGSWTDRQIEEWSSNSDNVVYKGHCEDMVAIWAQTHAAILPSWGGEGVPKALLEAAACGRAIISTNVAGCREVVETGRNGLLVPPRDVRALADAVKMLAFDPQRCASMGAEGSKLIRERRLSSEDVTMQTETLYHAMLRQASGS